MPRPYAVLKLSCVMAKLLNKTVQLHSVHTSNSLSVTDTTLPRKQETVNMVRNCIFAIVTAVQVQVDTCVIQTLIYMSLSGNETYCIGSQKLPTRPYLEMYNAWKCEKVAQKYSVTTKSLTLIFFDSVLF